MTDEAPAPAAQRVAAAPVQAGGPVVWTVGHSTWPVGDFIDLLREHAVTLLLDVRRYPGSRRNPQYGSDALAAELEHAGIAYLHLPELGGRRNPRPDSRNGVWRNPSFRGYADHMASAGYRRSFDLMLQRAGAERLVLCCAERLWWQCHRSMIADDVILHGGEVRHILGPGKLAAHSFREPAHLEAGVPVYGPGQGRLL